MVSLFRRPEIIAHTRQTESGREREQESVHTYEKHNFIFLMLTQPRPRKDSFISMCHEVLPHDVLFSTRKVNCYCFLQPNDNDDDEN